LHPAKLIDKGIVLQWLTGWWKLCSHFCTYTMWNYTCCFISRFVFTMVLWYISLIVCSKSVGSGRVGVIRRTLM